MAINMEIKIKDSSDDIELTLSNLIHSDGSYPAKVWVTLRQGVTEKSGNFCIEDLKRAIRKLTEK